MESFKPDSQSLTSFELFSGDTPLVATPNGQCGNGVTCVGGQFGDCCSTQGWCGSTPPYCLPSNCQPSYGTCQSDSMVLAVSSNGACGNGITCQGSAFGDCCSQNGYCGSTAPYCSAGCQSLFGTCGFAELPVSEDGSCGNGVTCEGSTFGSCCSKYGYCGDSYSYCTAACQAEFGTCQ